LNKWWVRTIDWIYEYLTTAKICGTHVKWCKVVMMNIGQFHPRSKYTFKFWLWRTYFFLSYKFGINFLTLPTIILSGAKEKNCCASHKGFKDIRDPPQGCMECLTIFELKSSISNFWMVIPHTLPNHKEYFIKISDEFRRIVYCDDW